MERIRHSDMVLYQFEQIVGLNRVTHGVFTRRGGVSPAPFDSLNVGSTVGDDGENVLENRRRMAAILGYDEAATRTSWQVHGADILVARRDEPQPDPPLKADGIITADAGLPLVMRFADCIPLVFVDPIHHVVGLAHAGWRGTVTQVGPATVLKMTEVFGSRPADIVAGIGPGIGPCCYEVGSEVVNQVRDARLPGLDEIIMPPLNGHGAHLDLWLANQRQLEAAGLRQIEVAHLCTACHPHEFFSHRAEAGRTGRFGVTIMLQEEASE